MKPPWTGIRSLALSTALLVVSGALVLSADAQRFSEWSEAVNLGPVVNSPFNEAGAFVARDGLTLYFNSDRPGTLGGLDIYVSQRAGLHEPWGPPVNLGPVINSSASDQTPTLSPDGHLLFFASGRPGGFGALDLYVSRRHNKLDDFGWGPPVNLGAGVNTPDFELGPAIFNDEESGAEVVLLYLTRGPVGARDINVSALKADGWFGPAEPVLELNTPFDDARPAIRRDGLQLLLDSNRPGTAGALDLWVSTRATTNEAWGAPVNLGAVNSDALDARPSLSFDGQSLFFHSGRPGVFGGFDLYVSTRTKLRGTDDDVVRHD